MYIERGFGRDVVMPFYPPEMMGVLGGLAADVVTPTQKRIYVPEGTTYGNLPNAVLIEQLVIEAVSMGYGLGPSAAVQYADGRLRPEQRFYDSELIGAADRLSRSAPEWSNADGWYIALKNKMGYRITQFVACPYGFETDPVTRECIKPSPKPAGQPKPTPEPEPVVVGPEVPGAAEKLKEGIPVWILAALAAVAGIALVKFARR